MSRFDFVTGDLHAKLEAKKQAEKLAREVAILAEAVRAKEKLDKFGNTQYYNFNATTPAYHSGTSISA